MKKIFATIKQFVTNYPAVAAAIVIIGYYLITTLNLFKSTEEAGPGLIDFIIQYDSLILLWLVAYLFLHIQTVKKNQANQRLSILKELEKTEIASNILNSVVEQLQDTINNPLALIATHTDDLRKKYVLDPDVVRKLDHIDALLSRIHSAIKDISAYQAQVLLEHLKESTNKEK